MFEPTLSACCWNDERDVAQPTLPADFLAIEAEGAICDDQSHRVETGANP
jgi:hypothetical protein